MQIPNELRIGYRQRRVAPVASIITLVVSALCIPPCVLPIAAQVSRMQTGGSLDEARVTLVVSVFAVSGLVVAIISTFIQHAFRHHVHATKYWNWRLQIIAILVSGFGMMWLAGLLLSVNFWNGLKRD